MSIRVRVVRGEQAIVPIRFVRAVTGHPPVRDAPEVDDRGFQMGTRPGTWGQSGAYGSMVAIAQGDTVRIKVLREDIDSAADLYVSCTDSSVVEVVRPASGTPLPITGEFSIKGNADKSGTSAVVQVHFGKQDGPVIGELEPHVFQVIRLRVAVHLVSIDGGDTNRWAGTSAASQPGVVTLLEQVNDIWRPAGVEFRTNNLSIVRDTVRRDPANPARSQYFNQGSGSWLPLPAPLGATGNFTTAGTITDNAAWTNRYREFDTLRVLNFINNRVNIYCVHDGTGWRGLSYVGRNRGLAITDNADRYDLAHELGHYLNNNHADEDSTGTDTDNKDIWLVRRLMYSGWPAAAPPYRNNVGYGAGQYGAFISVKQLGGTYSGSDGELNRSRRRARSPFV